MLSGVALGATLLAYLGASVSFPAWVARLRGVDLRAVGSRKLGGSNLWRSVGPAEAVVGGLLDAAKGPAAVLGARALDLPLEAQVGCALAATAGQCWPAFHRFDGGRGNSTGWGAALALDPRAGLLMLLPVGGAIALRLAVRPHPGRLVPLAALLSFAVFPAVVRAQDGPTPVVSGGLALLALIIVRRIAAGLAADRATGAPLGRILANRALYDRSELQERGAVGL